MINVDYIEKSLVDTISGGECQQAVQMANCFQTHTGDTAVALMRLTNGATHGVDIESVYGDINKLGDYTTLIGKIGTHPIEIHNLYVTHGIGTPTSLSTHWKSLCEGLISIIGLMESGETIAIDQISDDEFYLVMSQITSISDEELPDVNIIVCQQQ
jgi:hypothetical protein